MFVMFLIVNSFLHACSFDRVYM